MTITPLNYSNIDLSVEKSTASSSASTNALNFAQGTENSSHQSSIDEQNLQSLSEKLNEQMDLLDTNIRFGFSDKLGELYIKVTEKNTGRIIRQIPSEEALRLMEHFKDVVGLIFNKES